MANPLGAALRETVLTTLTNQPSGVPGWSRRRWRVEDENGRLRLQGTG